jgi:hypothetical protein
MRNWRSKTNIPSSAKIGISLVTYHQGDSLASLIHSIKAQTYKNYYIHIMHDGPWSSEYNRAICLKAVDGDPRFFVGCTETRANKFGHNMRQAGFDAAINEGCDWIGTMNGDCWYAPVYFEWMLGSAYSIKASFVYCNMVHSHTLWGSVKTSMTRGKIDGGGFLMHKALCDTVKWTSTEFAADWFYIDKLKNKPGFVPAKVDGYLFTHN